jgi:hypothetical protein
VFNAAAIPGMIEPGEQQMLTQLASEACAGAKGAIVEFGCFFGRSTACLVNGAAAHWAGAGSAPLVHAYDSFGCADADGFAPQVRGFARQQGLEHLLVREGGRLDFYPVYRHHLAAAEDSGLLRTTRTELRDARYEGGPIGLMHLDAPKFYSELKPILTRFFPHLTPGAAVVFQDHLYHWSATMIAAVQLLVEAGFLRLEGSRATALISRVERTPRAEDLLELDLAVAATSVAVLIDRNIAALGALPLDRPDIFLPRVHLAKVQWLWDQGEFAAAHGAFAAMMQAAGGKLTRSVFADFQELMRYGFTLRKLYELDH